jgi:putative membrane protein
VLTTAAGSIDKLAQLRKGVDALNNGAIRLDGGLAKAEVGSGKLAAGAETLGGAVGQLADGVKQLGAGLRTMDHALPAAQDLTALKTGGADLAKGHAALAKGLQDLQTGAKKLADGGTQMHDETKGIPIVGGKVSDGASKLAAGGLQLEAGLQSARNGQAQLAEGTQRYSEGVNKLADGMSALGGGIHTAAEKVPADAKLDELASGGRALAQGSRELQTGLAQIKAGSHELSAGLGLLKQSLPNDMTAPDGSPRGLADSVEPALEIVAPVSNNGAGYAPNFLAVSLWLGAVMTAFLFHLRRLPQTAALASRPAKLLGKLGILTGIVTAQFLVILLMSLYVLKLHVSQLVPFGLTMLLASITFLLIIVALTRAFGDAGKAAALILLILQLSSAGGVLPVELSGGFYQTISPWLPFTWVIKALRATLFGAYEGQWLQPCLTVGLIGSIAALSACFIGRWKLVSGDEHRPAMDI